MADNEQQAHVPIFAHPHCGLPLTSTASNAKKNLEIAEAKRFNLQWPVRMDRRDRRRNRCQALGRTVVLRKSDCAGRAWVL
jgi:hypothetical protein